MPTRPFFAVLLLLVAHCAAGQGIHEVKAGIMAPFFRTLHFSYEYLPKKSLGLEASVHYRLAAQGDYYVPFTNPNPVSDGEFIHTQQQILILSLAVKYYFFQRQKGDGWYLGAYLRDDVLTSPREPQYQYLLMEGYNWAGLTQTYTRRLRFGIGGLLGYKYLINRHWFLEASLGGDVDLLHHEKPGDFASLANLSVGYRF